MSEFPHELSKVAAQDTLRNLNTPSASIPSMIRTFLELAPLSEFSEDELIECLVDALPEPEQNELDRLTPQMVPKRTLDHIVQAAFDQDLYRRKLDDLNKKATQEIAWQGLMGLNSDDGVDVMISEFERHKAVVGDEVGEWSLKRIFRKALQIRQQTELMIRTYDQDEPLGSMDYFERASLDELVRWASSNAAQNKR